MFLFAFQMDLIPNVRMDFELEKDGKRKGF